MAVLTSHDESPSGGSGGYAGEARFGGGGGRCDTSAREKLERLVLYSLRAFFFILVF
jgi:hypothetical protein